MSFFKKVNRPFILFFALTISIPGWAMPIVFEFTGTVSDSVLISRRYQTIYTNVPEWNGLQVTGSVVMELPELAASPSSRSHAHAWECIGLIHGVPSCFAIPLK